MMSVASGVSHPVARVFVALLLLGTCSGCGPSPEPGAEAPSEVSGRAANLAASASPAADPPSVTQQPAAESYQLPAAATPAQLLASFAQIDRQMQRVATQQTEFDSPQKIQDEIRRLAGLKLQAAEQLAAQPSLPPEMLTHSKRAKLQALSHLVALGDASSAIDLRSYAEQLAASSDPVLAMESRLVLVGFAMEELQSSDDPQPVVELVKQLAENTAVLDMNALMTMGQARGELQQYGYIEAARQVRDQMVTAFANHPDPAIRGMSEDLASAERFDPLDSLRRRLEQGEEVTAEHWRQAANDLLRQGADLAALRYLSEAALHFEVTAMDDFTAATYQAIRDGFADAEDPALREEQQVVLETYAARQQIIGNPLQVDLPDTAGAAVDWESFRGRIVLMPFWAAEHPESVSVFRLLEKIRDQHSDQVALLGVNVDFEDISLSRFEREFRLDWPSLRSPDPLKQGIQNPLARQTGVTSFPFVVLIDAEGIVREIFLTNLGIERAVKRLLDEQNDTPQS